MVTENFEMKFLDSKIFSSMSLLGYHGTKISFEGILTITFDTFIFEVRSLLGHTV